MNLTEVMWIGIDPGKKGGIATIIEDIDGESISVYPYSNETLREILKHASESYAKIMVEKVGAMPRQGVSSTFTFGMEFGYILGMIEAFQVGYQLVTPQVWKKEFGCTSDKQTSIDVCKRLFPKVNLLATERSRKDSDGLAESLLLCEYARRTMKGGRR